MFRNFRSIINCFLFFKNWNWICKRVILIIVFCTLIFVLNIFRWTLKRSWRTRSFSVFIRFYSTVEKIKSHLRSRRTHFTHLFDFFFTRHFLFKRLQFSQKRIMIRFDFVYCKRSRRRRIKDLIMRRENIKKDKLSFRNKNLKRRFNVNISLIRYEEYAKQTYFSECLLWSRKLWSEHREHREHDVHFAYFAHEASITSKQNIDSWHDFSMFI